MNQNNTLIMAYVSSKFHKDPQGLLYLFLHGRKCKAQQLVIHIKVFKEDATSLGFSFHTLAHNSCYSLLTRISKYNASDIVTV